MSPKAILLALACLIIGTIAGALAFRPSPAQAPNISPELAEKFQRLTEADIEEYYQLKDAKAKYEKADEILGKIMAIFLADLGLHVSQHAQDAAKAGVTWPEPARVSESHAVKPLPPPPPPATAEPLPNLKVAEARLVHLRNDRDLSPSLEKVRLPDLDAALRSSGRLSAPQLVRAINGRFVGTAPVTYGGQNHDWDVTLEFHGAVTKGELSGSCQIALSENGHVFSSSDGKGSQTATFRELPSDQNAMLVKVSPTVVFQLYYLADLDRMAGNVYRRDAEDRPFAYVGTVTLQRN